MTDIRKDNPEKKVPAEEAGKLCGTCGQPLVAESGRMPVAGPIPVAPAPGFGAGVCPECGAAMDAKTTAFVDGREA